MQGDFRLGDWLVQPMRSCMESPHASVPIEPKAMDLLVYLANRAGHVVTKQQLVDSVWDGAFVTDEVLTNSIYKLRQALGDDPKNPRFIQTVPKRGYQLIASVEFQKTEEEEETSDRYRKKEKIGAGAMGEVYLAEDALLGRQVALKFPLPGSEEDETLRRRLLREARAAAALDHPFICKIYDTGVFDGRFFIAMEYVPGETLKARLARGSLSQGEALQIALEAAEALETAHANGFIHRDIKPSNIMVTEQGHVKVMDFGVAKRLPTADGDQHDFTRTLTGDESTLGTLPYMSPEQIRGQALDARSDIFSLGVVLYEMLTGAHPFRRGLSADTAAAILGEDPDPISTVNPAVSPLLQFVVKKMLAKMPAQRYQSIHEVHTDLNALSSQETQILRPELPTKPRIPGWVGWIALGLAAVALLGWAAATGGDQDSPYAEVVRFEITEPQGASRFADTPASPDPVVDPTGSRIAFVADGPEGESQIWIRDLDEVEAYPLPGTAGSCRPFWSDDGQSLGFVAWDPRVLKVIDNPGIGIPRTVAQSRDGSNWWDKYEGLHCFSGGAWNDETILVPFGHGINRFPVGGGESAAVSIEAEGGEQSHLHPAFLDGDRFIYTVRADDETLAGVYLGYVDGSPPEKLLPDVVNVVYAGETLLFVRNGVLLAQPFDPSAGRLVGDPTPLTNGLAMAPSPRYVPLSAAANVLVYRADYRPRQRLAWLDRQGQVIENFSAGRADAGTLLGGALDMVFSPDATRVAYASNDLNRADAKGELVEVDLEGSAPPRRLVRHDGVVIRPVWSPDGRKIAFTAAGRAYIKEVNDQAPATPIQAEPGPSRVAAWTEDGLVFYGHGKLRLLPQARGEFRDLTPAPGLTGHARMSPDGRWLAYTADQGGVAQVFVQEYPTGRRRQRVSPAGGTEPQWGPGGRELYFLEASRRGGSRSTWEMTMASVPFDPQLGVREKPTALFSFETTSFGIWGAGRYVVHPVTGRFLVNLAEGGKEHALTVVVNWRALLDVNVD